MTYRAIGRLTVVALTGTFILAAVPAMAASNDKSAESTGSVASKHHKKIRVAHRRNRDDDEVASSDRRGDEAAKNTDKNTDKNQAKVETKPDALPTNVADARAQMTADDVKAKPAADASVQATSASATESVVQGPAVQVVNADELNDLDKAATDVTEPFAKLPPSVANSRAEMRLEGPSPWGQTSTIGKAFIAFGVMLTLASAARMFMA
jgi:hypothetical protein